MLLAERTSADAGRDAPVVLVPIGSCEQHGPHLPLGTDTLIAETLAARAADRLGGVLVAPSLAITASGEHQDFPGTLSLGSAVVSTVIVELVRSADWSGGVVLVNGHGGNADAVEAARSALAAEGRDVLVHWPELRGGDAHAGITETALLLAIRPDLVVGERAAPGATAPIEELLPTLREHGVRAVSPNGVLGDPTGATAEAGAVLLDRLVADLVETISTWTSR